MGKQSSRLYYQGKDHKDIFFQGKYHDKMYKGSQLVWEKIYDGNYFVDYSYINIGSGLFESLGVYRINKYGVTKTPVNSNLFEQDIYARKKLYNNSYQILGAAYTYAAGSNFFSSISITNNFREYKRINIYEFGERAIYPKNLGDNFIYIGSAGGTTTDSVITALVIKNNGGEIEVFAEEIIPISYTPSILGGTGNYVVLNRSNSGEMIIDKAFNVKNYPSTITINSRYAIGIIGDYEIFLHADNYRRTTTLTAINLSNYSQYPDYVIQEYLNGTIITLYETSLKWIFYLGGYLIYFDTRTGWRVKQFIDISLKVFNSYWKDRKIKFVARVAPGEGDEDTHALGGLTVTPLPTVDESGNIKLNAINNELAFGFSYSYNYDRFEGYVYLDNLNFMESENNYIYITQEVNEKTYYIDH